VVYAEIIANETVKMLAIRKKTFDTYILLKKHVIFVGVERLLSGG